MKRAKFMQHLRQHGCVVVREGGRHAIVENSVSGRRSPVPRHPEVEHYTIRDICKQLDIELPREK